MIPYGTFTFFLIAFIVLLPVIIMGLVGKRSRIYNGISTMVMIILIFSSEKHNLFGLSFLSVQLINFILYILWQVAIIMFTGNHVQKIIHSVNFLSLLFYRYCR